MDAGVRGYDGPSLKLGEGLTSRILQSGKPIRVGTVNEAEELGVVWYGAMEPSYIGVPIATGDKVIGVMSVADKQENRYSAADEQLLSTIASSMGVALENARLFDETKRLLTETEQRNAELAVINDIGEALSKQLDFQGIIDAVGNRVSEIFNVKSTGISLYDPATGILTSPYTLDLGERIDIPPIPLNPFTREMIVDRRTLRLGTAEETRSHGAEIFGTDVAESFLGVPITASDRVLGLISIERVPRHAFNESDERLLSTIASSMGVALENARLFDETKRLLTETEQRNAELAVINEIGDALAKELDFQGIVDAVGDRVSQIFNVKTTAIALYDPATEILEHALRAGPRTTHRNPSDAAEPVYPRDGRRAQDAPTWDSGRRKGARRRRLRLGRGRVLPRCSDLRELARPGFDLHRTPSAKCIQRVGRTSALDDRFFDGRRARERAAVRRDEAPPDGDRRTRGRARDHQRDRLGARQAARFPGNHRCRRRTSRPDTRHLDCVHLALRPDHQRRVVSLLHRGRRAL